MPDDQKSKLAEIELAIIESRFSETLTVSWEYQASTLNPNEHLQDALRLAEMLKNAHHQEYFRHIEANVVCSKGQVKLKTTRSGIHDRFAPLLVKKVSQEWMNKGVHRNVYLDLNGDEKVPIEFPNG